MRNSVSVILRRPLPLLGFIQVSEACEAFRKGERSLVLSFLGMASSTAPFRLCPDAVEAGPVPLVLTPQRCLSEHHSCGPQTQTQVSSLVPWVTGHIHEWSSRGFRSWGNPHPQSCGHTMPGRHHFLSVLAQNHAPRLPSEGAPIWFLSIWRHSLRYSKMHRSEACSPEGFCRGTCLMEPPSRSSYRTVSSSQKSPSWPFPVSTPTLGCNRRLTSVATGEPCLCLLFTYIDSHSRLSLCLASQRHVFENHPRDFSIVHSSLLMISIILHEYISQWSIFLFIALWIISRIGLLWSRLLWTSS